MPQPFDRLVKWAEQSSEGEPLESRDLLVAMKLAFVEAKSLSAGELGVVINQLQNKLRFGD